MSSQLRIGGITLTCTNGYVDSIGRKLTKKVHNFLVLRCEVSLLRKRETVYHSFDSNKLATGETEEQEKQKKFQVEFVPEQLVVTQAVLVLIRPFVCRRSGPETDSDDSALEDYANNVLQGADAEVR